MTTGTDTISDVEYAREQGTALLLDLHRPATDEPVACVAYFHGGGWARGSRKDNLAPRLLPIVEAGLAVASVDYRLTDTATYPAPLDDARTAIRWLRAHGSEYGLKTERLGAWGTSAGGWIALMLALTKTDSAGSVQAVVAWQPVTDLLTVRAQQAEAGLPLPSFIPPGPRPDTEAGLLGVDQVGDAPEAAVAASPVTHASDASAPILLIHGDGDGLVNCAQSVGMHSALLAAGRPSQLLVLSGANHEDPQFQTPPVLSATAGFLSALL